MTDRATRNAEIAASLAAGEPAAAIATRCELTTRRVRAIGAAAGVASPGAGRPRTGAVTIHTARGRAALARLVADAAAAGVEVEAYQDRARQVIAAADRDAREDADRSAERPEVDD